MHSVLNQTVHKIQYSGRQAVTLERLDLYFHPQQFLNTLKQAAPQVMQSEPQDVWQIVTDTSTNGDYNIRLLVLDRCNWVTVAAYLHQRGRTRRCIYYSNGDCQPCFLDLPSSVVKEMAQEDFRRNWLSYYREFLYVPSKRSLFPTAYV